MKILGEKKKIRFFILYGPYKYQYFRVIIYI